MLIPLAEDWFGVWLLAVIIPTAALTLQCLLGVWILRRGRRKAWSAVLLALSFLWSVVPLWVVIQSAGEFWRGVIRGSAWYIFVTFVLTTPFLLNLLYVWIWLKKPKPAPPPADPSAAG